MHTTGKVIRPLFAVPVTFFDFIVTTFSGTSFIWTTQINSVVYSLIAAIRFWLDKSTRREPKR